MWNVFLFVMCGGSLIYGFVQHQKVVEMRVQRDGYQHEIDSLKTQLEKYRIAVSE